MSSNFNSYPNPPPYSPQGQSHQTKSLPQDYSTFSSEGYQNEIQQLVWPNLDNLKTDGEQTSNAAQTQPENLPKKKFTRRQLLIFLVYSFTEFSIGAVVSLQSPFYPAEAEKKGLTATEYGLVFGIFEFIVFAASFVYGKYTSKIGPKRVYNLGLLVVGISNVAFGTLDRLEGRTAFFALSMVVRILEALATAGCINAAFTIIALEFPDSVATTFSTLQMLFAVGMTCGPIIGGALYQVGGYPLPFYVVGIILMLLSVFVFFVFPNPLDSHAEGKSTKGLFVLVRIPVIAVSALVIMVSALSIGHLAATLEPHIREFNLSSVSVGLVIVVSGATYAVLSPIWGLLCDKKPALNLYMLLGCVFTILGYLLIGPAPFLPIDKKLWIICVGLVLQGIGIGGSLVSSFLQCLKSAEIHGFPNNTATYSLVSGIWTSFFSLGNFVGPTVSGILYDAVGFQNGTLFVIGLMLIAGLALSCLMCFGKKTISEGNQRRLSEYIESAPLLGQDRVQTYDTRK